MNAFIKYFLKKTRTLYTRLIKPKIPFYNSKTLYNGREILTGENVNKLISELLVKGEPAMICRFGSSELHTIEHYLLSKKYSLSKYFNYVKGGRIFFWDRKNTHGIFFISGVFPETEEMLEKFSEEFISHLPNIDVLASWLHGEEYFFMNYFQHARLVSLLDYEPYFHKNPWSMHLMGKKVLIVHPFIESIKKQYKNRQLLFSDQNVLPEFELITYKTVLSLANSAVEFNSWNEALQKMVNDISKIEFDIAIIGAGAYGLPLASYIKRMNKIAIHMGGATQVLFGIWGKRYEDPRENKLYRTLRNQYWTRPLPNETPLNYKQVEGGSYW